MGSNVVWRIHLAMLVLLLVSSHGMAAEKPFPVIVPEKVDLRQEMSALTLTGEDLVAEEARVSPMSLQFGMGFFSASTLDIDGYSRTVRYENLSQKPLVIVGFQGFPWGTERRLGWALRLGYSRVDLDGRRPTTLHLVPLDASLAWRFKFDPRASWTPYVNLGAVGMGYVQRGVIETDNSSGVRPRGKAALGLLWRPSSNVGFVADYSAQFGFGTEESGNVQNAILLGADLPL